MAPTLEVAFNLIESKIPTTVKIIGIYESLVNPLDVYNY